MRSKNEVHILEIGSGQGFNTNILSKNKGNKVVGIDLSKEDVRISKKRYPHIEFKVMNAESLKFKKASFDIVYAIEVLEHVDNIQKVLHEISRVLKPRGKLIASIPYHKSEKWLLKVRPTYFKEIHHVRIFKENELDTMLSKIKFNVIKKKRIGFLRHFELYVLFKRKIRSKNQLSIGSWRDNVFTMAVHIGALLFDPLVLKTPLVYFPIWIVTLPVGLLIDRIGSIFFPKSYYYEFIKK